MKNAWHLVNWGGFASNFQVFWVSDSWLWKPLGLKYWEDNKKSDVWTVENIWSLIRDIFMSASFERMEGLNVITAFSSGSSSFIMLYLLAHLWPRDFLGVGIRKEEVWWITSNAVILISFQFPACIYRFIFSSVFWGLMISKVEEVGQVLTQFSFENKNRDAVIPLGTHSRPKSSPSLQQWRISWRKFPDNKNPESDSSWVAWERFLPPPCRLSAHAVKQRISAVCVCFANRKVICAARSLDSEWNMLLKNVISDVNKAPLYLFWCYFSFPNI